MQGAEGAPLERCRYCIKIKNEESAPFCMCDRGFTGEACEAEVNTCYKGCNGEQRPDVRGRHARRKRSAQLPVHHVPRGFLVQGAAHAKMASATASRPTSGASKQGSRPGLQGDRDGGLLFTGLSSPRLRCNSPRCTAGPCFRCNYACSIGCTRSKVFPANHSRPSPVNFKIYM